MIKLITLTSLAVTLLSSTVLASASGSIDAITLSSGGVAEISRKPAVSNDGIVEIEVPLNQVDDVLKSLVLKGGKGAIKAFLSLAQIRFRKLSNSSHFRHRTCPQCRLSCLRFRERR